MNKKLFLLGMVSIILTFGMVFIGCEPTQGVPGPAGADGQAAAGVHSSIPPDSPLYNAVWATDNWTAKTGIGIVAASSTSIKATDAIENTAATVAQQGRENALERVMKSYSAVALPDGRTFITLEYVTVSTESINTATLILSSDKQSMQYGSNRLTKKTGADPTSFTVRFDSDGGSAVGDINDVEPIGVIALPTPPTKDASLFAGWYTDAVFTTKFTAATPVIANITLYARWAEAIALVPIASGTFNMGTIDSPYNVMLSAFSMGKYEITQVQYEAVMGTTPSYYTSNAAAGEVQGKRPVESVSWYDAIVFCNTLSMKEGLTPAYTINGSTDPVAWGAVPTDINNIWNGVICDWTADGYRLPTEAEWEYACRAGTTSDYNTGWDGMDADTAPGWYSGNSNSMPHEVGKKPANDWDLYDMHGNVYEWCWDWYASYDKTAVNDPQGASTGSYRVYRGGRWDNGASYMASAYRDYNSPYDRYYYIGFRVIRPQF